MKDVIKEERITWRSFWDGPKGTDGPIHARWNAGPFPMYYLIDSNGVIRYKDLSNYQIDKAIETLLSELGHDIRITHDSKDQN